MTTAHRATAAEPARAGRPLIGASPAMTQLIDAASRVAARDVTVLIRGETGTGKELVAELLHAGSPRAAGPLIRFNCAALPTDLADAELFGHVRGAFTGAIASRHGFFAQADGGTLVLDEIGELSCAIQAKLLRALQAGEIQPVGSGRIERVDVRIVASTHRDLLAEARAGRFREDLYYRLAVVELVIPPLRARRADIPALAAEFARRYGEQFGLGRVTLEPALLDALVGAAWPGNVRQLENTIARLAALSCNGVLALADAPTAIRDAACPPATPGDPPLDPDVDRGPDHGYALKARVETFERGLLARALDASGGNQSAAARRLGVSRVTLIDKMKKYNLIQKR